MGKQGIEWKAKGRDKEIFREGLTVRGSWGNYMPYCKGSSPKTADGTLSKD